MQANKRFTERHADLFLELQFHPSLKKQCERIQIVHSGGRVPVHRRLLALPLPLQELLKWSHCLSVRHVVSSANQAITCA